MANAEGITPSRHEVERQLERMLADPLFLARPKQAAIFEYLVKSALDGAEVNEKTLFAEFFTMAEYKRGSTNVRTTVSHIRALLAEYCTGEAKYDPVVISLPAPERSNKRKKNYRLIRRPEGRAYTPSFSYNPSSWIARELAVAHHLLRGRPHEIAQAERHLEKIGRAEPDHPEVMLGTIEAWVARLTLGTVGAPHETLVAGPLWWLARIEKEHGATWRTHGLRAMLHSFMGDTHAAREEFEKGLRLNRQATIGRGWYLHFLFLSGHEDRALSLMALAAEENADSAAVHAHHGIYLLHAHRHEDAARAFAASLALDRNFWLAHYGLARLNLELGNRDKAHEHATRLAALVEPAEFAYLNLTLSEER